MIRDSHKNAVEHGFWDASSDTRTTMLAEKLALVHSEVSEALESLRKGEPDYWIRDNGKPEGMVSELIDTIIRSADILGFLMSPDDVETAYVAKAAYNKQREALHGKLF